MNDRQNTLFVTGTGTDVGKTYVTAQIATALREIGILGIGVYKPVSSGCIWRNDELLSNDAEQLWLSAGKPRTLHEVSPQRFEAALAPNVAARTVGQQVDRNLLRGGLDPWAGFDFVLVEGVGGLMSPISDHDLVADLAVDFAYPLLIVVANQLGCINDTLQTLIAAEHYGLRVRGIVLNDTDPVNNDESQKTNRSEIERLTDVPVLTEIHHDGTIAPKVLQQLFSLPD